MNTALDLAICNKLLTTTRSIRKRLDLTRSVPPELIEDCLEIALQSPSATNYPEMALCGYSRSGENGLVSLSSTNALLSPTGSKPMTRPLGQPDPHRPKPNA